MTQRFSAKDDPKDSQSPFAQMASADRLSAADNRCAGKYKINEDDALLQHPNFDPDQLPKDPARPIAAATAQSGLASERQVSLPDTMVSKWQLIASNDLQEHLDLLSAAGLMQLSDSFYEQNQKANQAPLIADFDPSVLLDLADIDRVLQQYPTLTRFGMTAATSEHLTQPKPAPSLRALIKRFDMDSRLNSDFIDDWQVILQPEDFETDVGRLQDSLALDILPCSVAVHVLKSCNTRKTINRSLNAEQICQFARSFVLSQAVKFPARRDYFRQIRLFSGHIIVAALLLGFEMEISRDGACYFNISSRSRLFLRYPNLPDYHINGWSN